MLAGRRQFPLDFFAKRSMHGGHGSSLTGLPLSPASAARPPRGFGGGGAMLRRNARGSSLSCQSVNAPAPQNRELAQKSVPGRPRAPSQYASTFEADAGRGPVKSTERRHD